MHAHSQPSGCTWLLKFYKKCACCVCVCVCVCVCAANLLAMSLVIHCRGLVFCGVANDSSFGQVEGQGALELTLQANYPCIYTLQGLM